MIEARKEVCSMGYTLSFVASVKVGRGGVAGLLHHDARDVDREQGAEVRHSNKDIDPARTLDNETIVSDGQGGWMPCSNISQIEDAIDARLGHVTKPLRKDAVVLRPLVLQLDPDWYADHIDDGERGAAANAMLAWAADTFGADNVVYAAIHQDEGNPHLHVGICPVTEDGRLSQKDWFSSPAALRQMHDDFRQHMTDAGYEIEMQRKKPGKHARRMSVEEYKDFCDLQTEARKIDVQQGQLSRWAERLHEEQADLQEREKMLRDLEDRERKVQQREQDVEQRERALEGRQRLVEAREDALPGLAAKAAAEAVQGEIEASQAARRRPSSKAAKEDAARRLQTALDGVQATCDAVEQHQEAQQHSHKTLSL